MSSLRTTKNATSTPSTAILSTILVSSNSTPKPSSTLSSRLSNSAPTSQDWEPKSESSVTMQERSSVSYPVSSQDWTEMRQSTPRDTAISTQITFRQQQLQVVVVLAVLSSTLKDLLWPCRLVEDKMVLPPTTSCLWTARYALSNVSRRVCLLPEAQSKYSGLSSLSMNVGDLV